jgi:hypothetical protein
MGLSYYDMYNISSGIQLAFTRKTSKRLLTVSHGKNKRDQMEKVFPVSKYKDWSRENFIVACLYINFIKSPSSFEDGLVLLRDLDEKEVFKFKNEIINYRKFLTEDINRIKVEEGSNPGLDYMIKEYRENRIKWYTFYFYLVVSNTDMEKLSRSRLNGFLLKKIKRLLLYITFSEKSMLMVKELMKDGIEI